MTKHHAMFLGLLYRKLSSVPLHSLSFEHFPENMYIGQRNNSAMFLGHVAILYVHIVQEVVSSVPLLYLVL